MFLSFGFRLNWTVSLTIDTMLTLIWVVGMINAFNLLDNMDGLCGGLALIVGTALLLQLSPGAAGTEAFFKARYLALLMGATAGLPRLQRVSRVDFHGRQRQPAARRQLRGAHARSRARRRGNIRPAVDCRRAACWCC